MTCCAEASRVFLTLSPMQALCAHTCTRGRAPCRSRGWFARSNLCSLLIVGVRTQSGPLKVASPCPPRREPLVRRTDKSLHQRGNLVRSRVQCEMTAVHDVHFGFRHVAAIGLRLRGIE